MEENTNDKTLGLAKARPVEVMPDGLGVNTTEIPWAEVLWDDEIRETACHRSEAAEDVTYPERASHVAPEKLPGALFSVQQPDGLHQEDHFPWAEIVPDDLAYLDGDVFHEAPESVTARRSGPPHSDEQGRTAPDYPPWAEVLDWHADEHQAPNFARVDWHPAATGRQERFPRAAGGPAGSYSSEKSTRHSHEPWSDLPHQWYHEPFPIPVPIMPIAFFMMMIFVLYW